MDLTSLTPAQIDELWAPVAARVAAAADVAHRARLTLAKCMRPSLLDGYRAKVVEAEAVLEAVRTDELPFRAEWSRRGGWNRAYLVAGGHVHRSTACHTLHVTTQISWLPEQSGKDEAEIVELAGERACTVCYPSAPVNVLSRPTQLYTAEERRDNAAKAQRAQELAAKRAAKAAKAITNPDGTPLRDSLGFVIATERTAEIEAVNLWHDTIAYEYEWNNERSAAWDRIIVALSHKRGMAVSDVSLALMEKGAKKAAKTKREIAARQG